MGYNNSVSVVIPVYNGAETIGELVNLLENVLEAFSDYQIILVNDNSADKSFSVIKKLAHNNKKIVAIDLEENYGQQRAIYMGIKKATCDYTVIMDDDIMHRPDDIVALYHEILKGFDVVYGISDTVTRALTFRNIGSKMRDYLFYRVGGLKKGIYVSSFRIMSRELTDSIHNDKNFIYISMEIFKCTKNIGNLKVSYQKGGPTNYSAVKLIKLFLNIYIYYTNRWFFKKLIKSNKKFKIKAQINGDNI